MECGSRKAARIPLSLYNWLKRQENISLSALARKALESELPSMLQRARLRANSPHQ